MRRHWQAVGERYGIVSPQGFTVSDVIDKLVALTPDVVQRVQQALPPEFPSEVADPIFNGLLDAASRLRRVYD